MPLNPGELIPNAMLFRYYERDSYLSLKDKPLSNIPKEDLYGMLEKNNNLLLFFNKEISDTSKYMGANIGLAHEFASRFSEIGVKFLFITKFEPSNAWFAYEQGVSVDIYGIAVDEAENFKQSAIPAGSWNILPGVYLVNRNRQVVSYWGENPDFDDILRQTSELLGFSTQGNSRQPDSTTSAIEISQNFTTKTELEEDE